jgi:hypothetical protein
MCADLAGELRARGAGEQSRIDPLEEIVAQPIRFDDPLVHRIGEACGRWDDLQVRPGHSGRT